MVESNSWPRVVAQVEAGGKARVNIGGTITDCTAGSVEGARARVIDQVGQTAAQLGRSLHAWMIDPGGQWPVIVRPDGTVEADPDSEPVPAPESELEASGTSAPPTPPVRPEEGPTLALPDRGGTRESLDADLDAGTEAYFVDPDPSPLPEPAAPPEPAVARPQTPSSGLPTRRQVREAEQRRSFIASANAQEPSSSGRRGLLTRMGVRMGPTDAERAERDNERAVSQHWPGVRTVTGVNGKGGSGKTPATILLAAAFARWSGSGVLAWDANQTRGTLGWRTEQGPHDATVLDLLPEVDRLLGSGAQSGDMAGFVHHQTRDSFDVLRSQPLALAADQRVSPTAFDRVWAVAARFYPLLFIDTGNDESDEVWLRVVDHTDQLVVPTNTRGDSAEAGALLLDALRSRDAHGRELAEGAVVIVVSQADPKAKPSEVEAIVRGFEQMGVRGVATVPYEPSQV